MGYTDLIFDLYGTLVDIHTEEDAAVWDKTALYFGYYGAHYTGPELKEAFLAAVSDRKARQGQSYECFPEVPYEELMARLFRAKGIEENADALGFHAGQLFRVCSTDYVKLYDGVTDALKLLKRNGFRLWLLSNAQRIFTAYELRHLQLEEYFDGIWLSSDYQCQKPDLRFYQALLGEKGLDPEKCLMIGNDRKTDIAGAINAGLDTLYMHTALTPPDQLPADPALHPDKGIRHHYEYEGWDWADLAEIMIRLSQTDTD